MADRFPELSESDFTSLVDQKNNDLTKQLLNSVIVKYNNKIYTVFTPRCVGSCLKNLHFNNKKDLLQLIHQLFISFI